MLNLYGVIKVMLLNYLGSGVVDVLLLWVWVLLCENEGGLLIG